MESEVALDFFIRFLEKRGVKDIDLKKELAGLISFGKARGCFTDLGTLFEVSQWQKYEDILWDLVIDKNKTAKKLMKAWRAVNNCLQKYHAEKKIAAAASAHLEGKPTEAGKFQLGIDYVSTPPIGCSVLVKTRQEIESVEPTTPLLQEEMAELKVGVGSETVAPLLKEEHEENGSNELTESEEEELGRAAVSDHDWNAKVCCKRRGRKNEKIQNADRESENRVSQID